MEACGIKGEGSMGFWRLFFRTRKVRCPDGTVRVVYNDVDLIFPLAVTDKSSKINGGVDVPEIANANLSVEITAAIKGLVFSIDSTNSSLLLEQRGYYAVYSSNPCESHSWFGRQMEDVGRRRQRLQEQQQLLGALITLAQNPNADPKELVRILERFVDRLPPESAAVITIRAMDDSETAVREMIEGGR